VKEILFGINEKKRGKDEAKTEPRMAGPGLRRVLIPIRRKHLL
jgi:hypothetical protein